MPSVCVLKHIFLLQWRFPKVCIAVVVVFCCGCFAAAASAAAVMLWNLVGKNCFFGGNI
jgi:hypothetical protein